MAFNFLNGRGVSALAMATGILVSGCGGGSGDSGNSADEAAATSTSSTSTSTTTSTAVDSSSTTQASVSSTSSSTTGSTVASSGDSVTSSLSGPTTGATTVVSTDPQEPVTVATSTGSSGSGSTTATTSSPSTTTRSAAALNVSGLSYYSPESPTIDIMKRAGAWLTQCSGCTGLPAGASAWDTKEEAALDLDANGWIKSLPASTDTTHKYRTASTMLATGGAIPLGQYVVRYDGAGTITYSGGFTKNASASTPGRDVITLTSTANAWMTITATTPSNYLRNIRVYMPGGACANDLTVYAASASACTSATGAYVPFESFPATQIWHPQFLQDIKGFRALRFMDWNLTNSVTAATWADRTPVGARTWTAQTGVPIETEMDLATLVGADAWMNIPPYANDDYATQIGLLAAAHMKGNSKLDLEWGNEPWNYSFTLAGYILAQVKTKWPTQVSQGVSIYTLADSWYGERLSQACRAAKTGSSQIRCVLNGQAASSWGTDQVLSCPYAATEVGHKCAKDIDVVAVAPYFGGYIGQAKLRSVVSTWYTDADGGLNKLFQEITGQDASGNAITAPLNTIDAGAAPTGALAQAKAWMVATKAVADTYGLPMWAYEGGQHLIVPVGDTDQGLLSLFVAANRDPRMGAAYDRMMSDWKSSGGQTFTYYTHIGAPSGYGMWGLKETVGDNANPKWTSALKNRNALNCSWSGC